MIRISNFQLYCILVTFITPLAFLDLPDVLADYTQQNAWIPAILALIPGYGLVLLFNYILQQSKDPFPHLLIEHLGQALGRILGFLYILLFLFLSSFSLRVFTDFIETNVLPGTPISIHIGVLIIAMILGIRAGIGNLARLMEIIVIFGLSFVLLLLVIIIMQQGDIERLMPIGQFNYKGLALGTGNTLFIASRIFIVLSFGFWCHNKKDIPAIMIKAMLTYALVISLTALASLMVFGSIITSILTFPTFSMVTLVNIGNFIQNIDIVFIGVWIMGIYGLTVISWFMACYTAQIIFNLHDYRFLAAASSLVVGITSIVISANILELVVVYRVVVPLIYSLFFVVVPLLLGLLIRLKAIRTSSLQDQNMA